MNEVGDEGADPPCELLGCIMRRGIMLSCEKGKITEIFNRNVDSVLLRRIRCAWLPAL